LYDGWLGRRPRVECPGGAGRPAGSLAANTSVSLNLLSLFKSTVTLQSPDFEVGAGGAATLHLERRFSAGSLVDLDPRLDYTVRLIDRTSGKTLGLDLRDDRRQLGLVKPRAKGKVAARKRLLQGARARRQGQRDRVQAAEAGSALALRPCRRAMPTKG
jgi:hypothetical protein